MSANAFFEAPLPVNEPVLEYRPGSAERIELMNAIRQMKAKEWEIPMVIGGEEIFTENKIAIHPPHELSHTLGYYSRGDRTHARDAIKAALDANSDWEKMARSEERRVWKGCRILDAQI